MKAIVMLSAYFLLFGGLSLALTNTEPSVPDVVKTAFSNKYPTAKKVKWEVEATDEFEVEFRLNGKKMSANFKADGSWLETEMEIKKKDLPITVLAAITKDFPGFEVEEVEQVETPNMALAYEVSLEDEETEAEWEAVYHADGTLLKKEMESEDNDDDDK